MSQSAPKHVVVIGAGFGGLSAAAYLAKAGYKVTMLEKTDQPGGRARVLRTRGFTFDMGPSWYMMPDVFEDFFKDFGHKPTDFYKLTQLNPSYRVFTGNDAFDSAPYPEVSKLFATRDPESPPKLQAFLKETGQEYDVVRARVLEKPMQSMGDVLDPQVLRMLISSKSVRSFHSRAAKVTKDPDLQKMLEFMAVFMGGGPRTIPALYSLLGYVDMGLGVWYPDGGFGAVAQAFEAVAEEQGVTIRYNSPVTRIMTKNGQVTGVRVKGKTIACDAVVANADYEFVETQLLTASDQTYHASYWQKRTVSPSGLLLFIGTKEKLPGLLHHNLFFDTDWDGHFDYIFKKRRWTSDPLFYLCAPSKTDKTVAPAGQENLFVLAPMAAGVRPTKAQLATTITNIMQRIEQRVGKPLQNKIVVQEARTADYFMDTFNAYQGNAFGLSHTLRQSALLRPRISSRQVKGLYYTGQYTNPGTGVPMVVLSGKVSATVVQKNLQ